MIWPVEPVKPPCYKEGKEGCVLCSLAYGLFELAKKIRRQMGPNSVGYDEGMLNIQHYLEEWKEQYGDDSVIFIVTMLEVISEEALIKSVHEVVETLGFGKVCQN